jgi:small basic protein
MVGVIILITFVGFGILTGLNVVVPFIYSKYIAVAILACLDSVFGAFSANIEKKFRINIFLSGFFGNAIIAMVLVFIGEKLNVDIYLAAVIVFSGRILNNFSNVRRDYIDKINEKMLKVKK